MTSRDDAPGDDGIPRLSTGIRELDELMDGLPWNGDPLMYPELTNARLDEVRATLAEEIIRLQAL